MTTVGRWSPNKVRARVLDGTWVSTEELGGMVLLTPTSVDITGGGSETATTLANGSVEFTACGTVSLNGVFSAAYNNYIIALRSSSSANAGLYYRMRTSGSDESSASNYYTYQQLYANNTSVTAARASSSYGSCGYVSTAQRNGEIVYVYGPFLAQPTAVRGVDATSLNNASIFDVASTHSQSVSYDGITWYPSSGTMTGLVSVFGLVGA